MLQRIVIALSLLGASALCADPFTWRACIAMDPNERLEPGAAPRGPYGSGIEKSERPAVDMDDLRAAIADFNRQAGEANRLPNAARAPYPYFHSLGEINSNDRGLARPAWFDADYGYWYESADTRANRGRLRGVIGVGSFAFDYTHILRGDDQPGAQWFKTFLGYGMPMYSGYLDLSIGGSWLDDHADFHNQVAFHSKLEASIYPIYPLGIVGGIDFGIFENGRYTIDWEVEAKVQVWRSVFLTLGWRDIATPGHHDSFRGDGIYFGISLTFSNVRTMFTSPQGGPADGIFDLLE